MLCTRWINCSQLKQFSSEKDVLFPFQIPFVMKIFRYYSGLELSFSFFNLGKTFSKCLPLLELKNLLTWRVPKSFLCGRFWLWILVFRFFRYCNLQCFNPYAKRHDDARSVRSETGRWLRYFYILGRTPSLCLLGYATVLNFSLYVVRPFLYITFSIFSTFEAVCPALYLILSLQIDKSSVISKLS